MGGGGASEGWCLRLRRACARDSTHVGIIDRLKPMGDWMIVVKGVSSGCKFSRSASATALPEESQVDSEESVQIFR